MNPDNDDPSHHSSKNLPKIEKSESESKPEIQSNSQSKTEEKAPEETTEERINREKEDEKYVESLLLKKNDETEEAAPVVPINDPIDSTNLGKRKVDNYDEDSDSSTSSFASNQSKKRHSSKWEWINLVDAEEKYNSSPPLTGSSRASSVVSSLNDRDIAELEAGNLKTFYPLIPSQHLDQELPRHLARKRRKKSPRRYEMQDLLKNRDIKEFDQVHLSDIKLEPSKTIEIADSDEILDLRFINYLNSRQLLTLLTLPVERRVKKKEKKRQRRKQPPVIKWVFPPKQREAEDKPELEIMKKLIGYSPSLDLDTVPSNTRVYVLRDKIVNFKHKLFYRLNSVRSSNYPVISFFMTFYGIFNLLLSSVLYVAGVEFLKMLQNDGYKPPLCLIFWELGIIIPSTFYFWVYKFFIPREGPYQGGLFRDIWPIWPLEQFSDRFSNFVHLWGHAVANGFFLTFNFMSYSNGDDWEPQASEVPTIMIFTPLFISLVAHYLLDEKFSFFQLMTASLLILGFSAMERPSFAFTYDHSGYTRNTTILSFAFIAALSKAFTLVTLKKILHINPFVIYEVEGFIGISVIAGIATWHRSMGNYEPNYEDIWKFALFGLICVAHKFTLYYGLKGEECSQSGVILAGDIIVVYFITHEHPDTMGYLGILIVSLAISFVLLRRLIIKKAKAYPKLKKIFFLL